MPEKPIMHGSDHRPGGMDPSYTGLWHLVGAAGEPSLLHGSAMTPTVGTPNPVPGARYRLAVGPANIMSSDLSTVLQYTDHQIEIQFDLSGLTAGDTIFMLPLQYTHEYDLPFPGHDDAMAYVACRLYNDGRFVYGVV